MCRFRSGLALVLTAAFTLTNAAPGLPAQRERFLPLAAVAHSFNVPVRHANGAIEVRVDGSWLRITPGDVTVSEDGMPMLRLTSTPVVHSGQLCISSLDVATLLDVDTDSRSTKRNVTIPAAVSNQSFEVKTLATPTPRPTLPPAREVQESAAPLSVPVGEHLVGNVGFELQRQANAQYYQFNADGGTKTVHGVLYANGSPGSRPYLNGVVTVGAATQHATVGSVADPLYGSLFQQSGAVGASYENAEGTTLTWANASFGDRHSVALSRTRSGITSVAALVSDAGGSQLLFGRQYAQPTRSGEFDREFWAGSRGAGAGLHYRTEGRLYAEARLGIATSGLPLIAGDAPNETDIGYQFSSNLGIRAGMATAHAYGSRPFGQLYGHAGNVQLSMARMADGSDVDVALNGSSARAAFDYGRAGTSGFLNFTGELTLARGVIEANSYVTQGNNSDTWFDYRLSRSVPSMTIGLESVRAADASRIGPTIGYTAPVPGSMMLGVELHPLMHGQGVRFTVQHQILALDRHTPPHFITVSLDSHTTDRTYAIIDGLRAQQLASASGKVAVPDGTHYISIQSADGKYASPEMRVVNGTPEALSMPLWPVIEIQGNVRLPDAALPALMGGRPSLAGIVLIVQPQNITIQTDENGNFDLPAQAIAPHSTLAADASTMPSGLVLESQAIPDSGRLDVTLKLSKTVKKVIF